MGGVDPLMVFAGFVVTMLTMFSLAGQSMLASVLSRRPLDLIVGTYFVAFFTELVPTVIVLTAMVGSWDRFREPLDCIALLLVWRASITAASGWGAVPWRLRACGPPIWGPSCPRWRRRRGCRAEPAENSEIEKRKCAMGAVLLGEEIDGVPVPVRTEPVSQRVRDAHARAPRGWGAMDDEDEEGGGSERSSVALAGGTQRPPPPINFDYPFRIRPPCGDEPILWKETGRNFDFRWIKAEHLRWAAYVIGAAYVTIFLMSMGMHMLTPGEGATHLANPMVVVATPTEPIDDITRPVLLTGTTAMSSRTVTDRTTGGVAGTAGTCLPTRLSATGRVSTMRVVPGGASRTWDTAVGITAAGSLR